LFRQGPALARRGRRGVSRDPRAPRAAGRRSAPRRVDRASAATPGVVERRPARPPRTVWH